MGMLWYYMHGGQTSGPVAFDDLKRLALTGELLPSDTIRQDGTFDWLQAGSKTELFPPLMLEPLPLEAEAIALPLDDGPAEVEKVRRRDDDDLDRRSRDRDDAWDDRPAGGNEAVETVKLLLKRAFSLDLRSLPVTKDEERELRRAGIAEATAQRYAVWRKSMLWLILVPTAFAALFHFISLVSMEKETSDSLSRFGMALMYLQVFSLFALPATAVLAALKYQKLRQSTHLVLIGSIVAFVVPILVALVPAEHLLDKKMSGDAERTVLGLLIGLGFYITLLPTILSLLPAISRACIRLKSLLPASIAPGWGFFASAPLYVLFGFVSFILIYHAVNNFLLLLGVLLWIGAPLIYLTHAELLIRPITRNRDVKAIARVQFYVWITTSIGILLLLIFLFTAKWNGKYLVGTEKYSSLIRPWDLDLHARWIEFVGRSLYLTVVFMDLLMRMNLSIWKQEKGFYRTENAADYDRDMEDLAGVVSPPRERNEDDED